MTTSQRTPFSKFHFEKLFSLLGNHRNNENLSTHHQHLLRLSCPVARLPSDFDPDCAWQFRVRWSWWSRRHLCQITRRPLWTLKNNSSQSLVKKNVIIFFNWSKLFRVFLNFTTNVLVFNQMKQPQTAETWLYSR